MIKCVLEVIWRIVLGIVLGLRVFWGYEASVEVSGYVSSTHTCMIARLCLARIGMCMLE